MMPAVSSRPPIFFNEITPGGDLAHSTNWKPVTADALHDALFKEDKATLRGWITQGRIDEAALTAPHSHSKQPLLSYLAKYIKPGITEEIIELIKMTPAAIIDARDEDGNTALLVAVKQSQSERIVEALLEAGADVNAVDSKGRSVLAHCVRTVNASEKVVLLCNKGVHLNAQDNKGMTAMHHAVKYENCCVVVSLIAAGANKDIQDNQHRTPLDIAESQCMDPHDKDQDLMMIELRKSQGFALSQLGNMLGSYVPGYLSNASTAIWGSVANSMSYALAIFETPSAPVMSGAETTTTTVSEIQ
ncbi:ankyrin repeat domain-containing protein [Bordetella tumulicola]|uniref:ankyrin repeat domain-containing protein n=1 Tax=Bordetella tumulicola TaxID=1649133 RepID=UPI0039EE87E4